MLAPNFPEKKVNEKSVEKNCLNRNQHTTNVPNSRE